MVEAIGTTPRCDVHIRVSFFEGIDDERVDDGKIIRDLRQFSGT
jgi:hypothetical protein